MRQAVARSKAIYEELRPETKAGTARTNARWNASDNLSFASATAEATGKGKRSVERAAARGEALGADLADIAGTSFDKGMRPFCHGARSSDVGGSRKCARGLGGRRGRLPPLSAIVRCPSPRNLTICRQAS